MDTTPADPSAAMDTTPADPSAAKAASDEAKRARFAPKHPSTLMHFLLDEESLGLYEREIDESPLPVLQVLQGGHSEVHRDGVRVSRDWAALEVQQGDVVCLVREAVGEVSRSLSLFFFICHGICMFLLRLFSSFFILCIALWYRMK